ncbi:hypothetical protein FJZ19_03565 [Candidatus Pacearchaeota archaeon]|nr:hypothetical protein [Candidatus Pacearchaeota archaeon]
MREETRIRAGIGAVIGALVIGAGASFYWCAKEAYRRALHELLNEGITHQYIDTNQDGRYDFYRFLQRKDELTQTRIGGVLVSSNHQTKNQTMSGSMCGEHTREECLRMPRIGDIEFFVFEDSRLIKRD